MFNSHPPRHLAGIAGQVPDGGGLSRRHQPGSLQPCNPLYQLYHNAVGFGHRHLTAWTVPQAGKPELIMALMRRPGILARFRVVLPYLDDSELVRWFIWRGYRSCRRGIGRAWSTVVALSPTRSGLVAARCPILAARLLAARAAVVVNTRNRLRTVRWRCRIWSRSFSQGGRQIYSYLVQQNGKRR
ncbi:hypothetical protein [Stutzerimonas xanthomarina]|uniref:hypothetical protein n=1 Tax=Stutzerimonas xanthomarina TaxID=271420 RepID=UPI003AA8A344